jgi:subtilisin family serine protease
MRSTLLALALAAAVLAGVAVLLFTERPPAPAPAPAPGPAPAAPVAPPAAAPAEPAAPAVRIDPARRLAARDARTAEAVAERRLSAARSGGQEYYVIHVAFQDAKACQAFRRDGATPLTSFDRFATLFVARGDEKTLDAIEQDPTVVWAEYDETAHAPPPPEVQRVAERGKGSLPIARGGRDGITQTGTGVIIAVIDTGIDYHNPEFITRDDKGQPDSRLLCYWDTLDGTFDGSGGKLGSRPRYQYPNGASIGTLYTRGQLNAELRGGTKRVAEPDEEGHGTACAAVAAGNGRNTDGKFPGVAPGADLIGVRIARGETMDNGYLLGAVCGWLDELATKEGKALVVSCSFGSQDGGHDGCRIEEQELNARFPPSAKGRALCCAAGNEAEDGLHARLEFSRAGQAQVMEWVARPNRAGRGPRSAELAVYVDGARPSEIEVTGDGVKQVAQYVNPLSGSAVIRLDAPAEGKLQVTCKGRKAAVLDAYVYGHGPGEVRFAAGVASASLLVNTPALASNAITVGSYDFNDGFDDGLLKVRVGGKSVEMQPGALSSYSCPGYSRRGDTKPDVAAPGQYHVVPAVPATDRMHLPRDKAGKSTVFNGTSAATPYTAGVVALMFEKKKDLTLGEVKGLLQKHATKDDKFVGSVPNEKWGYGKLDLEAVQGILAAIK